MGRIRIKICCISSLAEANMAIDAGAEALGLVSSMPSGRGVIKDSEIAQIAKSIPPPISTFLLTSKTDAASIIAQHLVCRTNAIQLVDHINPKEHAKLKEQLPGIALIQVVHVLDETSIGLAMSYQDNIDALLLDSGNPSLRIKQLGGTGKTHNWSLSRQIVMNTQIPVFLAGGLNPDNVPAAIEEVNPFGIDICSGVRTNGKLDELKLSKFIRAVKSSMWR